MRPAAPCSDDELERFVRAQAPLIEQVRTELTAGRKASHWMWFVFPQLRGLGVSPMAQRYGIASLEEAVRYLHHPVLGERLAACTATINALAGIPIETVFPYPDHLKFHSSMTLFERAARRAQTPSYGSVFRAALDRYFDGADDPRTLELLGPAGV